MSNTAVRRDYTYEGIIRLLFAGDAAALDRFAKGDAIGEKWLENRIGFERPAKRNQARDWGPRFEELRAIKTELRGRLLHG
jgi:hypothetical protein